MGFLRLLHFGFEEKTKEEFWGNDEYSFRLNKYIFNVIIRIQ